MFKWAFILRKLIFSKTRFRHYSQFGEDAAIPCFLEKRKNGFFVDVGCFHPWKYNNTYAFYRRGWRGINIDLDQIKIDAFKLVRPRDWNVHAAVSDVSGTVDCYGLGTWSLLSSLDRTEAERYSQGGRNGPLEIRVRSVRTRTLDEIIEETPFRNQQIDLLSVDTEGHDLHVLKSLSIEKYKPSLILVESHAKCLEELMASELHAYLVSRKYRMVNWVGLTVFYTP